MLPLIVLPLKPLQSADEKSGHLARPVPDKTSTGVISYRGRPEEAQFF